MAGGGVRDPGDIPKSCGVTRFRSGSMATQRRWVVAGSVGETALGSRFQGRGSRQGDGFASKRVTTTSPWLSSLTDPNPPRHDSR